MWAPEPVQKVQDQKLGYSLIFVAKALWQSTPPGI